MTFDIVATRALEALETVAHLMNEVLVNPDATSELFRVMAEVSLYATLWPKGHACRDWLEACLHYAGTA